MISEEIRARFLDYFKKRGHIVKPSASLIPAGDPTLLFTGAGMNQFKRIFLGEVKPDFKRVVSSQRCFRTSDLEMVGKTNKHHTFFEMLGNFSFGDYFKKEAIEWAWDFVIKELELPKEKLWISIYKDDEESFLIWHKNIGIPTGKIVRMSEEDNFWAMGATGPCGPCSEIIIDLGVEKGCGRKSCGVGCSCDRYWELWNLVFTQFERDEKGRLNPLPQKNIDTGMGLERIAAVLQGVESNFETDLFKPLINYIEGFTDGSYGKDERKDVSFKIVADHMRAIVFLLGDGVIPASEGRGYVLRRVLRRAIRHKKILGIEEPFLYKISDLVIDMGKSTSAELVKKQEDISKIILNEEKHFQNTLNQGMEILNGIISDLQKKKEREIPGREVFKLYDTYGFPFDLTQEIAREQGFDIGEEEFKNQMHLQQERARKKSVFEKETKVIRKKLKSDIKETEFVGYEKNKSETIVFGVIKEGKRKVRVILKETPFYAEAGGQIGDTGVISNPQVKIGIEDTKRNEEGLREHIGVFKEGKFEDLQLGNKVLAVINFARRKAIARNHTATHLLQSALREVLGKHVEQRGSLVMAEKLRFDFTHFQKLREEELLRVEELVNQMILNNLGVQSLETTLSKAKEMKALALFGERYGERVRIVKISEVSLELCGGTHVKTTGEIGMFKVLSESAISSGIRRIEAITGRVVYDLLKSQEKELQKIAEKLKVEPSQIALRVENLVQTTKSLEKEINSLRKRIIRLETDNLLKKHKIVSGIKVISSKVENLDLASLRALVDALKNKLISGVVVLGVIKEDKVLLVSGVTKDLVEKGIDGGKIVDEVAKVTGGKGGGRADLGQAGGKASSKLEEALEKVERIVKQQL